MENNKLNFFESLKETGNIYKLLGALVITLVCFSNSILNDFQLGWDDSQYILFNPLLDDFSLRGILHIFTSHWQGNYHPLTTISNLMERQLFGAAPGFYHLINLVFHLLNVCLVFVLINNLSGKVNIGFFVALLFGIHPMHVESVSWISERKDVLYAFFYLLALLSYLAYLKNTSDKGNLWLAFLFFVLSILSKSAGISLSILLFVFDYFYKRKINIKVIIEKTPFILLSVIFGVLAIYTQSKAGGIKDHKMYDLFDRLVLFSYGFSFYLYKLFLPIKLSIIHPYPQKLNGFLNYHYYVGAILPVILSVFLYIKRKTQLGRIFIFGFLFYLISIVMVLQIIPLGPSYVSERFSYIPYIGLLFIIAYMLDYLFENAKVFSIAFLKYLSWGFIMVYILFLCVTTYQRNKVWKDSITLFTDVIDKYPESHYAYWSRGIVKFFKLDYKGAIQDYTETIRVRPNYADAYYARAYVKSFSNDLKGAVEDYELALANNDTARNILLNIANAKYGLKEYPGAMDYYDRFLKKYPEDPEGYYGRSNALWAIGDTVASMQDVEQTLKFDPLFKGARHVLGIYKFRNKMFKECIEDLTFAIVQKPSAEDYTIRAKAKYALGANSSALEDYYEALRINPRYTDAYLHRGILQNSIGRKKEACQNWSKALNFGNAEAGKFIAEFCSDLDINR